MITLWQDLFATLVQVRPDDVQMIDSTWANPSRGHSTIGYASPMEFERIAAAA